MQDSKVQRQRNKKAKNKKSKTNKTQAVIHHGFDESIAVAFTNFPHFLTRNQNFSLSRPQRPAKPNPHFRLLSFFFYKKNKTFPRLGAEREAEERRRKHEETFRPSCRVWPHEKETSNYVQVCQKKKSTSTIVGIKFGVADASSAGQGFSCSHSHDGIRLGVGCKPRFGSPRLFFFFFSLFLLLFSASCCERMFRD